MPIKTIIFEYKLAIIHHAVDSIDLTNVDLVPADIGPLYSALLNDWRLIRLDLGKNIIEEGLKSNINQLLERNRRVKLLYETVTKGDLTALKRLDENGTNVNPLADLLPTTLFIAAQQGHVEVVKFLVEKGANVNAVDTFGTTVLYVAAKHGHLEIVNVLLLNNADNNAVDKNGQTALFIATQCGHAEIVHSLLAKIADKNVVVNNCQLNHALKIASHEGHFMIAKCLVEQGANINHLDDYQSPLYIACKKGHFEIVKFFLHQGASFQNNKILLLQTALENGHAIIAEYLKNFKRPLPQHVSLSSKNLVLVRMWTPKFKKQTISYPTALVGSAINSLFNRALVPTNVGHISISVCNGHDETYISHWPGTNEIGHNNTFDDDASKEGEDGFPDVYVPLYSLDTNKMIKRFKEIVNKSPWFLFGNKWNTNSNKEKAYNCSGYVEEILTAGGLYGHLLNEDDKPTERPTPITPVQVAEIAKKAQKVEHIIFPETKDFPKKNMEEFINELTERSQEGTRSLKALKKTKQTDYPYFLYKHYSPNELPNLLSDIYHNIEISMPNEKIALSNELLHSVMRLSIIDGKNGTDIVALQAQNNALLAHIDVLLEETNIGLIIETSDGFNALHCAIEKGNFYCVRKLVNKFPEAINAQSGTAHIHIEKQNTEGGQGGIATPIFSSVRDKISFCRLSWTPLDVALLKDDKNIIDFLKKMGGTSCWFDQLDKMASISRSLGKLFFQKENKTPPLENADLERNEGPLENPILPQFDLD